MDIKNNSSGSLSFANKGGAIANNHEISDQ